MVKLQQPRASILSITVTHFPRTGGRNKNHFCTPFTVESQFFFLHPDDVFGTCLSEETLLIPQRIFQPGGENLAQYLEN